MDNSNPYASPLSAQDAQPSNQPAVPQPSLARCFLGLAVMPLVYTSAFIASLWFLCQFDKQLGINVPPFPSLTTLGVMLSTLAPFLYGVAIVLGTPLMLALRKFKKLAITPVVAVGLGLLIAVTTFLWIYAVEPNTGAGERIENIYITVGFFVVPGLTCILFGAGWLWKYTPPKKEALADDT